ncbi:pre-mod(mdg4)-Y isoform X2 [Musca autumnalis]|uniref:pre-mod(mdg4)-Y isoform X2 n=1 Tax=Musca autumnalis TaxID=221902 RepID=UPI003CEB9975
MSCCGYNMQIQLKCCIFRQHWLMLDDYYDCGILQVVKLEDGKKVSNDQLNISFQGTEERIDLEFGWMISLHLCVIVVGELI